MEKLRLHLKNGKITHREFAARIGCDPTVFSRVMSGAVDLTVQRAKAIEVATGGAVTVQDLADSQSQSGEAA